MKLFSVHRFLTLCLGASLISSHCMAAEMSIGDCITLKGYSDTLGIRPLSDHERGKIKGNAWLVGRTLYLDLYNGNSDLTLSKVSIRLIPQTEQEIRQPTIDSRTTTELPKKTDCIDITDFYRDDSYNLQVNLPPLAATHQRVNTPAAASYDRFTWEIRYAEGYRTVRPFRWQMLR